jgi:hypothetical protein
MGERGSWRGFRRGRRCAAVATLSLACFASAAQADLTSTEGANFSGDVAQAAGCGNESSVSIDWGDGTTTPGTNSGSQLQGTHTYAEEGTYNGTVTYICNFGPTGHASFTATVADAALSSSGVSFSSAAGTSTSERVAHIDDTNPGADAADFTVQIDWGDGTASSGTVNSASGGGFDVTGTHAYAGAGSYTVTSQVADTGGSMSTATATADVSAALPGLPAGLDFTWSPNGSVLVAGAPLGGVQFHATDAPGITYQWDFDSTPGGAFNPDGSAAGSSPKHGFTADGAHDTGQVPEADGERRRLYTVRLRATAANGASAEVSHDLVVVPDVPPQVDFTVGGSQDVNQPTALTPKVTDPNGLGVANHVAYIEWSFDSPGTVDLICLPDGSGCRAPNGGLPGSWFSQGTGDQAVVNFFQRALAAHGLPELSTLNLNALPVTAPGGGALTGGLRVFDGKGPFTVYHDLRVAYLYDNATLLQQTSFALDAGEATGARLQSGSLLAGDKATRRGSPPRSGVKSLPYSSKIIGSNPRLRLGPTLAGKQLAWRQVTLTAVDTAGVQTSRTLPVPLRPVAAPELRAKFVDTSAPNIIKVGSRTIHLASDTQTIDHPLTTADTLTFDASGTQDVGGHIAYYTLEVGHFPQGCREPDKHEQQQYAGLPVFNSVDPPVDGYAPGEFFSRPDAAGTGLGQSRGRTGALQTVFQNPRNILGAGFTGARAAAAAADTGLPTLGQKLAQGRVVHSCSGGAGAGNVENSPSFAARNVFPSVFMTREDAAARPPFQGTRAGSAERPHQAAARAHPLEYATEALVTTNPSNLKFRIPNRGTYSVTVAAYNDAGLGAIQRTDHFQIESPTGSCDNVAEQVKLGGKTLGFSGECVQVGDRRTRFWTAGDMTINGVAIRPNPGAHLFLDTNGRHQQLFATKGSLPPGGIDKLTSEDIKKLAQNVAGAEVVLDRDPVAAFGRLSAGSVVALIRGSLDPVVLTTATYHGSPVAVAQNGGANRDTFHIVFANGSGDSRADFNVVLPKEFGPAPDGAATPTSHVARTGHTDVPATELTTNHFASIARHHGAGPIAHAASGGVSGGVSGSLDLSHKQIGPLTINQGTLSFDTGQGLWRGDIQDASLDTFPGYSVSFHIVIQNGALRELGGAVNGAQIPVFPDVFLTGVRFQIVTDPLTMSGGASFSAIPPLLTGDLDLIIRTKPVFLRLEGKIAVAGVPLANAYVQYDQANHNTVSFGGHIGFDFGPASMSADLDGAIADTGDFFIEGRGKVCIGICIGAGALMSNVAVALCGSIDLGFYDISAGAAYRFSPGKLELFSGCDLDPYKPAIFRSRDIGGAQVASVRVAGDSLSVAAGTREVAFRMHGASALPGAPRVTLISPTGRRYDTAPGAGDYSFAAPTGSGISQIGGALIDRDPVTHVTTAIVVNPPAGNWQILAAPGDPPLASVEVAYGQHIPDNAFKSTVAHASLDATTSQVRTGASTAAVPKATAKALRGLPGIERTRLVSAKLNLPAGVTGRLELLDVGRSSSKPIQFVTLTGAAKQLTIAFAPTDDPGVHQIQAIKFQPPGAGPALPQRTFAVGEFTAPAIATPTAPRLRVSRDRAGRVVVDVTPGSAGALNGVATTFELAASTASGERIEREFYGFRGVPGSHRRIRDQAQLLSGGRFRVVLPGIPRDTTVEVYGRMQYAAAVGRTTSSRLKCVGCGRGQ